MFWFMQGLCFLPVFLVIWSASTFITSYLIAIFRKDVDVIFPYIRYKFVDKLSPARSHCLNKAALGLGLLSCFSMCIVATFQETTVVIVHDAGALLFFISGVSYIILQSVISYQTCPFASTVGLWRVRMAVATLAALALFPSILLPQIQKQNVEMPFRHWRQGDVSFGFGIIMMDNDDTDNESTYNHPFQDYPFHLASAVCEWVVAFSFVCFFLTYIDDFKMFTLRVSTELEDSLISNSQ
ncbi:hypothetical protein INR49_012271 [Caranx melampygus]|nr:hypothetical protein INR49_012271 [Caranx melampygus]